MGDGRKEGSGKGRLCIRKLINETRTESCKFVSWRIPTPRWRIQVVVVYILVDLFFVCIPNTVEVAMLRVRKCLKYVSRIKEVFTQSSGGLSSSLRVSEDLTLGLFSLEYQLKESLGW